MNMQQSQKHYFIRMTNVALFNTLYDFAEQQQATVQTARDAGYYELVTEDRDLWYELVLYGQYLAQAQGEYIETGERDQ